MHSASEAFHRAVYENSPEERILLHFADDTFLSNEDIQVSGGVTVTEAINYEEELTIGSCLSSTFEATVINDHRMLSGYAFGECRASLGVRTEVTRLDAVSANCTAAVDYKGIHQAVFTGHSEEPYLRIEGGVASNTQPPFAVHAIAIVGRKVHCIARDGRIWAGNWRDMNVWDDYNSRTWASMEAYTWSKMLGGYVENAGLLTVTPYMQEKARRMALRGRGVWLNGDREYEFYRDGTVKQFEYVPLGVFEMDIPKKRRTDYIEIMSYDRMVKFDEDAGAFMRGLSYPITLKGLLHALCAHCEVPLATGGDFINSGITFGENPLTEDDDVTAKDILGWIAGAACSVARMTRAGELELAWFSAEDVHVPMNQYFDIDVTERDVGAIDGVQIASPSDGIDVSVGGE